ncbi:putative Protein phosphatase PTC7-like protein [Naja naja]|nr:putative Protein phosphatase PTC7-like protein [Naja naja]
MFSVLSYGRLVARAVLGGLSQTDSRDYSLVTASCGFGKDFRKGILKKGMCYGDDACFVARHRTADVLGVADGVGGWRDYGATASVLRDSDACERLVKEGRFVPSHPVGILTTSYCELLQHKAPLLGVADGVGGWRDYGVDPSQFSGTLMRTCERLVKEGRFVPSHPVGILTTSYCELLQHKAPLLGSSTACIVVLDRSTRRLHTANLGDSGFLVVRGGRVVHRSDEQQHYFNTPFQLSIAPPEAEGVVFSDRGCPNSNYESIQQTASSIAEQAHELAYDPNYMSPFAQFACDNGLNVRDCLNNVA